jgi:hypothetical protein
MSFVFSIAVRIIVASVITMRCRSAMSSVRLRRPLGSGVGTVRLALLSCIEYT